MLVYKTRSLRACGESLFGPIAASFVLAVELGPNPDDLIDDGVLGAEPKAIAGKHKSKIFNYLLLGSVARIPLGDASHRKTLTIEMNSGGSTLRSSWLVSDASTAPVSSKVTI